MYIYIYIHTYIYSSGGPHHGAHQRAGLRPRGVGPQQCLILYYIIVYYVISCVHIHIYIYIHRAAAVPPVDRWMDGWMGGWVDGWIDR